MEKNLYQLRKRVTELEDTISTVQLQQVSIVDVDQCISKIANIECALQRIEDACGL